ncbi:MAG: AI-2E family transporter [Proteobacteria bacterium]|nr:AI-2E family transporter [Pseudomonadota bacterium]
MNSNTKLVNFALSLGIVSWIVYLLLIGKSLLVPFVIAVVIWYLIISLTGFIQRVRVFGQNVPEIVATLLAILLGAILIWGFAALVSANISMVVEKAPHYQAKLKQLLSHAIDWFGLQQVPKLSDLFSELNFISLTSGFAQMVTEVAANAGIILIYVLFLLLEHHTFNQKLEALIQQPEQLQKTREIVHRISAKIRSYVGIKTALSLFAASLSYILLRSVGVDFPEFWALLIFLLHYIPTIGSIVATVFPCLLAIVQFESWVPFTIVALGLMFIQFVVGNILEPRLMGKSFNLSGLVILLSLGFWGKLWGITGMFLCVPFTVIASIILSSFSKTRSIAIFLSEDGKIKN